MSSSLVTIHDLNRISVERTITAVDPLSTPPETPDNVSATSRTFGILFQWSRIEGAEGYDVIISDTEDFDEARTYRVSGEDNLEYFYNTGNVAVTRYASIAAYRGSQSSARSSVVSATSGKVETGASQTNAPVATTFDNVETTLLTATLTCTGRNVVVVSRGRVHNPDSKVYDFKLKEDGNLIDTVTGFSTDEIASTLFGLRTPTAASHTYTMTGQNTTDATALSVDDLRMMVFEVPFSTSVESGTAPSEPPAPKQSPPQPEDIPSGPEQRYRYGY